MNTFQVMGALWEGRESVPGSALAKPPPASTYTKMNPCRLPSPSPSLFIVQEMLGMGTAWNVAPTLNGVSGAGVSAGAAWTASALPRQVGASWPAPGLTRSGVHASGPGLYAGDQEPTGDLPVSERGFLTDFQ